jgi:O-antigen/teichoic acid export membrane protein
VFFVSAIVKFGFPKSIIRFYSEFRAKNQVGVFYSTIFLSLVVITVGAALIIAGIVYFILRDLFDYNTLKALYFLPIIIVVVCINDILANFLRAEERTKYYNFIRIVGRYLSFGVSIILVLYFAGGLGGYFLGEVIGGVAILLILFMPFRKKVNFTRKSFSLSIFVSCYKFGFPLVWSEFGHLLLNYVDRYFIQFILGAAAVGIYSAGYNLGTYVTEGIIYPITYAMTPIYMRLVFEKGEEETKAFLGNAFRYYMLIALPAAFGFMGVGKDVIVVLATDKYGGAGVIFPCIVLGQLIHYSTLILDVGLMIRKKTYIFSIVILLSVVLNVFFNVVLIPKYGILGAAVATLLSYLFYATVIVYYSFREFSFQIAWGSIILYLSASLAMLVVIKNIDLGEQITNLVSRIGIGAMVYFLLIFVFDKEIRSQAIKVGKNLRLRYSLNRSSKIQTGKFN